MLYFVRIPWKKWMRKMVLGCHGNLPAWKSEYKHYTTQHDGSRNVYKYCLKIPSQCYGSVKIFQHLWECQNIISALIGMLKYHFNIMGMSKYHLNIMGISKYHLNIMGMSKYHLNIMECKNIISILWKY